MRRIEVARRSVPVSAGEKNVYGRQSKWRTCGCDAGGSGAYRRVEFVPDCATCGTPDFGMGYPARLQSENVFMNSGGARAALFGAGACCHREEG